MADAEESGENQILKSELQEWPKGTNIPSKSPHPPLLLPAKLFVQHRLAPGQPLIVRSEHRIKTLVCCWPSDRAAIHQELEFAAGEIICVSRLPTESSIESAECITVEAVIAPEDRLLFIGHVTSILERRKLFISGGTADVQWRGLIIKVKLYSSFPDGHVCKVQKSPNLVLRSPTSPLRRRPSVGGLDNEIGQLRPLMQSSGHKRILITGPTGTGKSCLIENVAQESGLSIARIDKRNATTISDIHAKVGTAQVVVLSRLHVLCPKSSSASEPEQEKIVAALRSVLQAHIQVNFVGETCRPNDVDSSILAQFTDRIHIDMPSPAQRADIMQVLLPESTALSKADVIELCERRLHGFVGQDIRRLIQEAMVRCNSKTLSLNDVETALRFVKPSSLKDVELEVPRVPWEDIGGQERVKRELIEAVELPLTRPEVFERFNIRPARGILLYGPPGCSKTLLAKALATSAGVNFLAIKGPEVFSKWVGESEKAVREIFRKARQSAPSILFMDEVDAIAGKRGSSSGVQERVLAQLLSEMDGAAELKGVLVVGATNRPDVMDPALLRPGRFDRIVYVGPPDLEARKRILEIRLGKMEHTLTSMNVDYLATETEGMTGAEVVAVCQEAAMHALSCSMAATHCQWKDFREGLTAVQRRRRVLTEDLKMFYNSLRQKWA